MIYFQLFYNFFLTGLFSIGGGLATPAFSLRPFGQNRMVQPCGYRQYAGDIGIDARAIGINMATYVGFETASVPGALIATLGLITPGIIIILIIAKILEKFKESRYVQWALYGLRAASIALISAAGLSVVQISLIHYKLIGQSGIAVLGHLRYQRNNSGRGHSDRQPNLDKNSSRRLDFLCRRNRNSLPFCGHMMRKWQGIRRSARIPVDKALQDIKTTI